MAEIHVGIVGGTQLPGNVQTFLGNICDLLADAPVEFQFDLVIRKEAVTDDIECNVFDPGIDETTRAIATIRSVADGVTRYAQSEQPDVLWQITKFPVHGFATVVAGKRIGIPTVTRFAGDDFREYELCRDVLGRLRTYVLNNVLGRFPARWSDATITLGPYGKEQIAQRGGTNVRQIPQPIDTDTFHPVNGDRIAELRSNLGLEPDERMLLTVGRLSHRKGMNDLLDTARELARRHSGVKWCVVGDGPLRSRLNSVRNVDAMGRVPHDQISDYYHAADLVVHPSLVEGLPNVLLEAAACGTPSLARDIGDCSVAASETYESTNRLDDFVTEEYEPVALGDTFAPDTLRKAYTSVLLEAAGVDCRG